MLFGNWERLLKSHVSVTVRPTPTPRRDLGAFANGHQAEIETL